MALVAPVCEVQYTVHCQGCRETFSVTFVQRRFWSAPWYPELPEGWHIVDVRCYCPQHVVVLDDVEVP